MTERTVDVASNTQMHISGSSRHDEEASRETETDHIPETFGYVALSAVSESTSAGLVAAFVFNEGSGADVFDSSGNGHVGKVRGTRWVAGKHGNALSFDGATQRIFADGNKVATRLQFGPADASNGPLRIGGTIASLYEYFKGYIDEVRIYNCALSAAQTRRDRNMPLAGPVATARVTSAAAPPHSDKILQNSYRFAKSGSTAGSSMMVSECRLASGDDTATGRINNCGTRDT